MRFFKMHISSTSYSFGFVKHFVRATSFCAPRVLLTCNKSKFQTGFWSRFSFKHLITERLQRQMQNVVSLFIAHLCFYLFTLFYSIFFFIDIFIAYLSNLVPSTSFRYKSWANFLLHCFGDKFAYLRGKVHGS